RLRAHANAARLFALHLGAIPRAHDGRAQRTHRDPDLRTVTRAIRRVGEAGSISMSARSRKDLACTADATAHQRAFVADLKRRVVDNGEPFAVAQADTPHEIFHAMDIPLISNQWWSAYISAKQLSSRYFAVLDRIGYPSNSCRYC